MADEDDPEITLRARYPDAPTEGSPYLHLIVNWLEVEAIACFFPRDRVVTHVLRLSFYRWMYRTAIADWDALESLYTDQGLVPLRPAVAMSAEDLRLPALTDEASILASAGSEPTSLRDVRRCPFHAFRQFNGSFASLGMRETYGSNCA